MRYSWKPDKCISNRWYDSPVPIRTLVRSGNTVVIAGGDRIGWYEVGGRMLQEALAGRSVDVRQAVVLPGEMVLLAASHERRSESHLLTVSIRDRNEIWNEAIAGKLQSMCIRPNTAEAYVGLDDGNICRLEIERGRIRIAHSWRAHPHPVTALGVSPKGVLTSAAGSAVSFWTADGKPHRPGIILRAGEITALQYMSDEHFAWAGQSLHGERGAVGVMYVNLGVGNDAHAALPYDFGCPGPVTALATDDQRRFLFWAYMSKPDEHVRAWEPRARTAISVWEYTSADQPAVLPSCVSAVISLLPTSIGGALGLLCNTRNDPAEADASGGPAGRASFIPLQLP